MNRDALWDNDSDNDTQSVVDTVNSEISELTDDEWDDEWDDDEEDLQEVTELTDSRKYIVYQSALIELYKQVRLRTLTLLCAVIIGSCYIFPGLFFLICPQFLSFCGVGFNFWSCGPYLSFLGVRALYINIEE